MPIKKSELYSSLWKSCDELRGGMDASQYKDYVLVLLFVKYVSDKYAGQPDALMAEDTLHPDNFDAAMQVNKNGNGKIGGDANVVGARRAVPLRKVPPGGRHE